MFPKSLKVQLELLLLSGATLVFASAYAGPAVVDSVACK